MKPTQAEVLLRMAENTYADNDETLAETQRLLLAGARRILDDEEFLIKAWEINQRDKARFAQYMPPEHRQQRGQAALGTQAHVLSQARIERQRNEGERQGTGQKQAGADHQS
jgi:hypothetical protein